MKALALPLLLVAFHVPVITPTDKPKGDLPPRIEPEPMPPVLEKEDVVKEQHFFNPAVLLGLSVESDPRSTEHMAYLITIRTSQGDILIRGNHDDGPNVEKPPVL